ncbi:helix-turn-helix domain-containing protein [Bacillus sp. 2205SS5-2]|uniref:helix-turn-helix domain-containing protein n=1 Tax=Bacillus sp. 2205SS5-2 TaxID=3109031 RepID=UPI00300776E9
MEIGKLIYELRKMNGLSQAKLAEGILSQAQISKIENGHEIPSSVTLYELSKRLNVNVSYFFEEMENPRNDYVEEVKNLIRMNIRNRDYKEVQRIISSEKKGPLYQFIEFKQFLTWHEGICCYYLSEDFTRAMELLQVSLDTFRTCPKILYSEREIEIINSMAIIYQEEKQNEKAIAEYKRALKAYGFLPHIKDIRIKIRVLYGLAKVLNIQKEYQESLDYSLEGIQLCINYESFYLFGELNYQCGDSLVMLNREESGVNYLKNASCIFEVTKKEKYVELVQNEMMRLGVGEE